MFLVLLSLVLVFPLVTSLFMTGGILFLLRHPIWATIVLGIGFVSQYDALKRFWNSRMYIGFIGRIIAFGALMSVIGGLVTINFDIEDGQFDRLIFAAIFVLTLPISTICLVTIWYFPQSSFGKKLVFFLEGLKTMGVVPK